MKDIPVTFKVNTRELTRQINKLSVNGWTAKELEDYIREHIKVTLVGSPEERRVYLNLDGDEL